MPARKVSDILGESGELDAIAERSLRAARLQRIYLEAVPLELAESSRVGWARGDILSVIADDGATAAKLKQIPSRVLQHLRRSGYEFNSMRIEVQVGRQRQPGVYRRDKSLSEEALTAIDQTLRQLPDSPLKAALTRLARRR